jgi:hypothetical protein
LTDKELPVLTTLTSDLAIFSITFAALLATAMAILRDVRASRPSLGA